MPSEKQIAASRANGAKSHGPLTPAGKRHSSHKGLRHGMLARSIVLIGESHDRFNELCKSLADEIQPATTIEHLLVQKMAVAQWRMMRLWNMEKASIDREVSKQPADALATDLCDRGALALRTLNDESRGSNFLNQYEMRYDRQFTRAHDHLQKYRDKCEQRNHAKHPTEPSK